MSVYISMVLSKRLYIESMKFLQSHMKYISNNLLKPKSRIEKNAAVVRLLESV